MTFNIQRRREIAFSDSVRTSHASKFASTFQVSEQILWKIYQHEKYI